MIYPILKSGFIEIFNEGHALYSADVGITDEEGTEFFYFSILTPHGLDEELKKHSSLFGKAYLFLSAIDEQLVVKEIEKLLSKISGETWDEVSAKVARYGQWQYEDYNKEPIE